MSAAGDAGALFTVVVTDAVSASGLRPLTEDGRFRIEQAAGWDADRLQAALAEADALIIRSATTVDRALLDAAPRLRVVGRAGVGVDNIDLAAATERGIPVLNAPAGNTVSAAELTLALILSLARRVAEADASVRGGRWERSRFAGIELRGKTLGLVGAGRIGGEVARRAQAFGMETVAHDPYLTEERAEEIGVERVELQELLERSDVVTLHVPLTASTRGLIGREELARMKAGAFVVNAARGGVVDEEALAEALAEGRIAGAALDVYDREPLPEDSPLRGCPNVLLTPHLGASTAEAQELVAEEIARAVRDALVDGDLSRAVNAPAIGGEELRRLRPLLLLGEGMGRVALALSDGGASAVEIRCGGPGAESLRPLSAAVLKGLLSHVLGSEQVNFVNALHLAQARGIRVTTSHTEPRHGYGEFLEVVLEADRRGVRVAGALLGEQHHPRIVEIDGYELSVLPQGTLLVLRNLDVPGVIGKVGTLLGEAGLNIGEYYQSRLSAGGEALAAVSVDGPVGEDVVRLLAEIPEITSARAVALGS